MRPKRITYTLAALNATGYASNVSGASWALDSVAGPYDGLAHQVTIHGDAATNHSGKTAIITGLDAEGREQTETIAALPNGVATVTSTKYFKSISSVVPSATIGEDTMDIGWNAVCQTPSYVVDCYSESAANISVTAGGTSVTYSISQTNTNPFAVQNPLWNELVASRSTSSSASGQVGVTALKIIVSAHTAGVLIVDYSQGK